MNASWNDWGSNLEQSKGNWSYSGYFTLICLMPVSLPLDTYLDHRRLYTS